MRVRWWQKLSGISRAAKVEWALFVAAFTGFCLLWLMHLCLELGWIGSEFTLGQHRFGLVATGLLGFFAFAFLTYLTVNRFHRMRARLAVADWEPEGSRVTDSTETSKISHVIPKAGDAIRVLLSCPIPAQEEKVATLLKQSFIDELGADIEIVKRSGEMDALCAVTDNVFDLVVLAGNDTGAWSPMRLAEAIKKLDRNIPVILFSDSIPVHRCNDIDGHYKMPSHFLEIRWLAHLVKRSA